MSNSALADPVVPLQTPGVEAPRRTRMRRVFRIVERGLAIMGLVLLIYTVGFRIDVMTSGSMSPTLQGNGKPGSDWVLSEYVSHALRHPRRWELVAFRNEEGLQIMKRVIGLPGEKVEMKKDGTVLIDGTAIERPASLSKLEYIACGTVAEGKVVQTGSGYFLLGDYARDSEDSRWEKPLQPEAMNGRPWLIVWPLSRFGFVNP